MLDHLLRRSASCFDPMELVVLIPASRAIGELNRRPVVAVHLAVAPHSRSPFRYSIAGPSSRCRAPAAFRRSLPSIDKLDLDGLTVRK